MSKKKTLTVCAVVGLFALAGVAGSYPAWKPTASVSGTYSGTAKGMGGDVTVTLTLKDNQITDVKAVGKKETQGIGSKAIEKLPGEIKSSGSIDVDGVSGATITSDAIKKAAEAALASAGLKASDLKKATASDEESKDVTKTADVVVVGAGGAGETAAVVAADAGKSVIILESQDVSGGNSVRSTGGMNAAKTKYQDENKWNESGEEAALEATLESADTDYKDNKTIQDLAAKVKEQYAAYQANPTGYFDSVELMELDTMIGGKGINDPELVKTLAENSSDAIDWVNKVSKEADSSNSGLTSVGQFGGASVKRIHRPVNKDGQTTAVGAYIMPILDKAVEKRGVEVMYNTTANKILMKDGKAVGVEAKGKSGNKVTVNAKSVVLATGGFGANNKMVVAQNHPELKGYITTNAAGAQGQGITMATAKDVNADTVDMDQIQLHPTVHVDKDKNAHLITEGLRGDGAILVNSDGKRFTNEVGTRDKVSGDENKQKGGKAWLIIDQSMVDASAVIQGYIDDGYTVTGKDAASLAKEIKADPDTLTETIQTWNDDVAKKSDPEFNRTSFDHQLTGNLYAIEVQPGIHHTMGGLKIDTSTEVLNKDGKVIPGLFAAGEVTGGVHGANRLGGNAVADFVVFGRIAGNSAADYAK